MGNPLSKPIVPRIAPHDIVPPASEQEVHDALKAAGDKIPRYLFRAWSEQSGGFLGLNTTKRIVPLAFSSEGGWAPTSVFKMPHQLVLQTSHDHMRTKTDMQTFFSSWSCSLAHAVSLALYFQAESNGATTGWHISILDTEALSRKTNWIHWCGDKQLSVLGIDTFPEEYQVFGEISGPCHSAVPLEHLLPAFSALPKSAKSKGCGHDFTSDTSPPSWTSVTVSQRFARRADAIRIGKLFGERFQLVVAVFYLCCAVKVFEDEDILAELEEAFAVSLQEWRGDGSNKQVKFDGEGKSEAEDAMRSLRTLGEMKMANGSGAAPADT